MADDIKILKKLITEQKQQLLELQEKLNEAQSNNLRYIRKTNSLEHILALMPGNVYWKRRDGKYEFCNINAAKTVGLESHKGVVGKSLHDFVEKKYADPIVEFDEAIMASNQERTLEEDAFDSEGNPAIYLTKKLPLHDQDGRVNGLLGISIDITERKKMEEELKIAKEKSEIANKVKTKFIHDMEHDIRTPLTGIWGLTTSIIDRETDKKKKADLIDIRRCSEVLLEYFKGILDFSSIEAGNLPILFKKFKIRNVIDQVMRLEIPAAKNKKLNLIVEVAEDIPDVVISDEFRIYRILINLVSNAIKFTHEGYVKVLLTLLKKERSEVFLQLLVQDTGIGIPKRQQDFIYEKFAKIDPSNKNMYTGLGLGLRIVKQFMEDIGGEIEVESKVDSGGKGTIFACVIPCKLPLVEEMLSE